MWRSSILYCSVSLSLLQIFFQFVEIYHEPNFPSDLKALAIQHILIPIFKYAFDHGDGEQLIGGPPNPDGDSPGDCISVFINKYVLV